MTIDNNKNNNYFMKTNEIESYLNENGIYPDSIYTSGDQVEISFIFGDWKHEHGYCRNLMNKAGYAQANLKVTEEDGSDCFSAIHTYIKF